MEELTRLRTDRGWSQQRLADEADVDKATVNQIERGRRSPNVETLEKLADALGVGVADFFPKAQAPLPFEDDQRREESLEEAKQRGAREALEELVASGAVYSAYEGQGRMLASRWQEELSKWEEDIPAGKRPDLFNTGRLVEWAFGIFRHKSIYEAMVRETGYAQRPEMMDTLKLLEDAEEAAIRMVKRVVEPIKSDAKFLEIWKANDMDAILSNAETDG